MGPCGSYVVLSTKKEDRTGPLNTPSSHSHPPHAPPLHLPCNTQTHRLAGVPDLACTARRTRTYNSCRLPRPTGNVHWTRSCGLSTGGGAISLADAPPTCIVQYSTVPANPMLLANITALCLIERELLSIEVLHCGNRNFRPFWLL